MPDGMARAVSNSIYQRRPYFRAASLLVPGVCISVHVPETVKICPCSASVDVEPLHRWRTPGSTSSLVKNYTRRAGNDYAFVDRSDVRQEPNFASFGRAESRQVCRGLFAEVFRITDYANGCET
jgi:hypothetical protein